MNAIAEPRESLVKLAHAIYALHAFSLVTGIVGAANDNDVGIGHRRSDHPRLTHHGLGLLLDLASHLERLTKVQAGS